ncbi:hypothetical protein LG299_08430 [Microbacterium lacus]|uniref:hypothetical protein n=1 Tax=Microbacterium lacus TaxID=415217 RepID=UPI00384D604C
MSTVTTKREHKAALRADRSGSGPTIEERPPARFPGAGAKFALLGEVLMIGLLVALVGVLVVTLPAGLAAGIRHLRRFVAADDSSLVFFWADVRRALPMGAVVGLASTVVLVILLLDIDLARSGFLPGGILIEIVGWVGLAALSVAVLVAAAAWSPETGWLAAVRSVPRSVAADPVGGLYLVATAGFVAVVTWVLLPLLLPALGLAALAAVAIPERRRTR